MRARAPGPWPGRRPRGVSPALSPAVSLALALTLTLALSACGYHLRGSLPAGPAGEAPGPRAPVRVAAAPGAGELLPLVSRALEAAGLRPLSAGASSRSSSGSGASSGPSPGEAARLELLGEERRRRVLSVGPDGRVAEYELAYGLRYRLSPPAAEAGEKGPAKGAAGRILEGAVERRRVVVFREEEALAREREQERVWEALRQEAAAALAARVLAALRGGR